MDMPIGQLRRAIALLAASITCSYNGGKVIVVAKEFEEYIIRGT